VSLEGGGCGASGLGGGCGDGGGGIIRGPQSAQSSPVTQYTAVCVPGPPSEHNPSLAMTHVFSHTPGMIGGSGGDGGGGLGDGGGDGERKCDVPLGHATLEPLCTEPA